MKIVGLVAEYNPFHNGHQYHIEQAKKVTGADHVIVVMSGNFVQRGTPAIMPKRMRCEAALKAGASLVIELPVCYSTASAEFFAYGAVSILDKLGCVDAICFGSECGDILQLETIALVLIDEPVSYKNALQLYFREGNSFPLARQKALCDYLKSNELDSIMSEPNNILGIEYLKALSKLGSNMKPYTITRIVSNYHDTLLSRNFSSASAIRREICEHGLEHLKDQVPASAIDTFANYYEKRYPVLADDFSLLLKYSLLNTKKEFLSEYADVSEELANRIMKQLNHFESFDQFCELLKTKELTYSRISRALLHILLGIKDSNKTEISYARLLGFRKDSTSVLSMIKEQSSVPLIGKAVGIKDEMLEQDIYTSNLYESVVSDKFKTKYINEYEQAIVIV